MAEVGAHMNFSELLTRGAITAEYQHHHYPKHDLDGIRFRATRNQHFYALLLEQIMYSKKYQTAT